MKTTKERNRRPPRSAPQLIPFTRKGVPPDETLQKAGTDEDGRDGRLASPGEGSTKEHTPMAGILQYPRGFDGLAGLQAVVANDVLVEPVGAPSQPSSRPSYAATILLRVTPQDDGPTHPPFQVALMSARPTIGRLLLRLLGWLMSLEWQGESLDVQILRVGADGIVRRTGTAWGNLASWQLCLGEICQEETERNFGFLLRRVRNTDEETLLDLLCDVIQQALDALDAGRLNLDTFAKALTFAHWSAPPPSLMV